jgi:AmmeMemoRadiSam system protein A
MEELLTQQQGRKLLILARNAIAHRAGSGEPPEKPGDEMLLRPGAAFVTLKINGKLRGCIGHLQAVCPLWQGVCDNAINAAFHDHRFSPLKKSELNQIHIDISVLTTPQRLIYNVADDLLTMLQPGVDGVTLGDGRRRATFLPQVWQQLPSGPDFLGHLCLKAGLPKTAWRDQQLNVEIYQVQCFEEDV